VHPTSSAAVSALIPQAVAGHDTAEKEAATTETSSGHGATAETASTSGGHH
jgi:hypothetical protein